MAEENECYCRTKIPLLYQLFNKYLAPLPIINDLCLSEYVIARVRTDLSQAQENIQNRVVIPM